MQYGDIKTVLWLVDLIYTLYSVFNVTIILDYMAAYILCFCPVWPAIALMYTGYGVRTVSAQCKVDIFLHKGKYEILFCDGEIFLHKGEIFCLQYEIFFAMARFSFASTRFFFCEYKIFFAMARFSFASTR